MSAALTPYVPRLVLSWAEHAPEATYRRVDGSMVFCDVSGFTALSERLARNGKVGAEELTEILDAVFSNLLERAATFGGSMLKYGGDAVLVFFWGEDHPRRAVAAAAAMRAGLREVGRSETASGRVRLRMSVGVHSGEFDFFLVGGSHRELIVAGPAATETCAMEAAANAGQILVSTATAAALPASSLGPRQGGGRLLRRAPAAAGGDPASLRIPVSVDPSLFVPVALRQHLRDGGQPPEHRQVALAFIGFGDIERLLQIEGGAAVGDRLDRLVTRSQETFEDLGVTFLATDISGNGGKIIAVAGAPTGWPNNEERLLRAVRAVADSDVGLPLHIGVNRGSVFVGDVGPVFRRTYTLLGDAVNTAARVMTSAAKSQIRSMPAVLDRSDTLFATTQQQPFMAKGKREPLLTYSVGEPVGHRDEKHGRLPLVGRDAELTALRDALDEAAHRTVRVVEVTGDAGIGKTRLVQEFVETIDADTAVLWTACQQYESTTPYFVAGQMLRAVLGLEESDDRPAAEVTHHVRAALEATAPHLVPWLPLIMLPLGISIEPTPEIAALDERYVVTRLRDAVGDLITAVVDARAAWVIEDGQWIDDASRELIAHVLQRVRNRPWLILITRRPDDRPFIDRPEPELLALRPLGADAAGALARAAAVRPLLPEHAALIASRGAGHPMFVRELAQAFEGHDELAELPDTVEAVVTARIDSLAPADRTALRTASVLGTRFAAGLLRELAPDADLRALRAFLTTRDGVVEFRQALFQHAAYASLPFRQRRLLHGTVARLLAAQADGDASDALLSLHAFEAQDYPRAWEAGIRAAHSARQRLAPAEAIALYRRAVTAGGRVAGVGPADLGRAWSELGHLCVRTGRLADARIAYGRARRLAHASPELQVELCLYEGDVRLEQGHPGPALRWYRKGLRIVDDTTGIALRSRLLTAVAKVRAAQGNVSAAMRAAREAIADAEQTGNTKALAHAWSLLGAAALMAGTPDAEAYSLRALELYQADGDAMGRGNALNNLGTLAYSRGDWDAARSRYDESRVALEAAGATVFAATTANNVGEILRDQGRWAEARAVFEEALGTLRAAGSWYELYVVRNLAVVAGLEGRVDEARDDLERVLARFRNMGMAGEVPETLVRLAEVELLAGRPEKAQTLRIEAAALQPA